MKQPGLESLWVQVVFPMREEQEFIYIWPKTLPTPRVGMKVLVPLGNSKRKGFVSDIITTSPKDILASKIKPVFAITSDSAVLSQNLSNLIHRICQYYIAPFSSVLKTTIPTETDLFSDVNLQLLAAPTPRKLSANQQTIVNLLKNGPVGFSDITNIINSSNLFGEISSLIISGVCSLVPKTKNHRKRKEDQIVTLAFDQSSVDLLFSGRLGKKQRVLLEALQSGGKNLRVLAEDFGVSSQVVRTAVQNGLVSIVHRPGAGIISKLYIEQSTLNELSGEQNKIFNIIKDKIVCSKFSVDSVFGVPGSGKTEIYLHAAKTALEQKKSVIVLVPEIALTGQVAARFHSVFGEQVALWHSGMSFSERKWTWEKLRSGQAKIVVGARSAVFSPLENVGLIIVDEEQETSFKQQHPAPRYHGRDVAILRAQIENAIVLLGSATPSLETYYNSVVGRFSVHHLPNRFGKSIPPKIKIVNMKTERTEQGEFSMFSQLLLQKIRETLDKKKQIILFQNRRGFSPFVSCGECDHIESCKNCHVSMTYHKHGNFLLCHHCGSRRIVPQTCPDCFSDRLFFPGTGIQQVEETLTQYFPEIRVLRMDRDTTTTARSHADILNSFAKKEAQVLLGTQMIGKGLDFDDVLLVGVLQADLGLHYPDFRSRERTFQLLYQVAGRAGRRNEQGTVIVQSASVDNLAIETLITGNIKQFYNSELSDREHLQYPPFSRMATLVFSGKNSMESRESAKEFRKWLDKKKSSCIIMGPAPFIIEKMNNQYRQKIDIRSPKATDPHGYKLRHLLQQANWAFRYRNNFKSVAMYVDVDPVNI